jgi:predicted alpha/beta-hydrolase family hydrolase
VDRRTIEVETGTEISSVWAFPRRFSVAETPVFILAHGAGSNMDHPFLSFLHEALAERGVLTVKFNFPYTEAGRKAPDHPQRLMQTWRAVIQRVRDEGHPGMLFLGGKSMGGRFASMVAAADGAVSGLVLLGYPLHPAKRLDRLRSEHLARIRCPMLFIQGTRDALCDLPTLRRLLAPLSSLAVLKLIEEGDHSFKVPKRTGLTEREVWDKIVEWVAAWLIGLAYPGR